MKRAALPFLTILALLALPTWLLASDLRPVYSLPSSRDRVQSVAPAAKSGATAADKAAEALQSPETSKRFMKTTHGSTPINKTPQKPPASLQ